MINLADLDLVAWLQKAARLLAQAANGGCVFEDFVRFARLPSRDLTPHAGCASHAVQPGTLRTFQRTNTNKGAPAHRCWRHLQ